MHRTMVRNTLKCVVNKDMRDFAKDLRTIYTAPDEIVAVKRLEEVDYARKRLGQGAGRIVHYVH